MTTSIRFIATLIFVGSSFLFTAQIPNYVPSNGLVGWWPFNGNANDLSGNNLNQSILGPTLTADRNNNANSAYLFNGASDYMECNPAPALNVIQDSLTISAWIFLQTTPTASEGGAIVARRDFIGNPNGERNHFQLNVSINRELVFSFNNNTNLNLFQGQVFSPVNSIPIGQWCNVIVTFNNGLIKLFLNGNILTVQNLGYKQLPSYNHWLNFGRIHRTQGNPFFAEFPGKIDDIGIWNRALTQQEITNLYQGLAAPQANITTPNASICSGQSTTLTAAVANQGTPCTNSGLPPSLTNGLVGYWPFCGNANDASGNGNNGIVSGATLTADRFGAANKAYDFNGSSRIDIGNLNNQIGSSNSSWSVNCWFKSLGSLNGDMVMVTDYSSATAGDQIVSTWLALWSFTFNHKVGSTIRNFPNGWDALSNTSYNDNQWHSMVSVAENGNLKIYIDGILITTTVYPANTNFQGSPFFRFGALLFNGQYDSFFQGKLDDIAIWNRALTQQEITQLYQLGQPTYSWSNGATTPSITVSPAQTTTYTCTISMNGAITTQSQTITVNPLPTVSAGANLSVCSGASVTLSGSGAVSYVWDNGVQDGVSFIPNATSTYTVIGTDANGCTNTAQVQVAVNALPVVSAGANQTICSGANVTLNGSGATSYAWNNNVQNGVAFTPNATQTYTVTGTDANGCSNTAQTTVTVNALPTVTATANQSICSGTSVTLSGSGAISYAWDNGVQDGVIFIPNATTTYTVTGTNANGCTNTAQTTVTVNALPTVNAGANQTVCAGSTATLNGSGAVSYAWNNNVQNGVPFTPNATQTYTLTGTDANGCQGTDQVLVTVASQTTSSITQAACLTYELNGQVYNQSGVYTQTLVNALGCDSILTLNLTINGLPSIPFVNVGGDNLLSTPLVANTTYQWVYCPSGLSISNQNDTSYLPNVNGSYAVEASNACGTVVSECVTIDNMGIEEVNNPLVIYPNPTPNVLYVQGISASETNYHLFDNQSKLLKEGKLTSIANAISLFELPSGLYHLYIGKHIFKIIKH
jgi:hypothetical protein